MAGTLKVFWFGFLAGVLVVGIIFGFFVGFWYSCNRDREIIEYVERQNEIEVLREDYSNRDPIEFLDIIQGVRGAVDGATAEFDRKRDEILQRFRNRIVD